jgi:serine O-acetyltransferase
MNALLRPLGHGELPLVEQLREDWVAHGRVWSSPGFRAVAVQRFGVWRMRIRPKLLRAPVSVLYRRMHLRVIRHWGIELPYSVHLGRRTVIHHQGALVVNGQCTIGDDCILRHSTTIGVRHVARPSEVPTIGNRVNIGVGAVIVGPITIGDDAQIGANTVVLTDVPAGATVVGNPARIIERR